MRHVPQPQHGDGSRPGPIDFVVVGHATHDTVAGEQRDGGTVSYAAAVAAALGLRAAIVTSAPADFAIGVERRGVLVVRQPAGRPTLFEHTYVDGMRRQIVRSQAESVSGRSVPPEVAGAAVVLFGPIAGELELGVPEVFGAVTRGATLQGWLRRVAPDGLLESIAAESWDSAPLLRSLGAAFLSEHDLLAAGADRRSLLDRWAAQVEILVITQGEAGASLSHRQHWFMIDAFPAAEVDSTGAGDAFAAAFLIRYHETADIAEAARFAAATAAFVVEAPGAMGAPSREQVQARMAANPEVRLRPMDSR